MLELAFNNTYFLSDLLAEVLNFIKETMRLDKGHQLWQNRPFVEFPPGSMLQGSASSRSLRIPTCKLKPLHKPKQAQLPHPHQVSIYFFKSELKIP